MERRARERLALEHGPADPLGCRLGPRRRRAPGEHDASARERRANELTGFGLRHVEKHVPNVEIRMKTHLAARITDGLGRHLVDGPMPHDPLFEVAHAHTPTPVDADDVDLIRDPLDRFRRQRKMAHRVAEGQRLRDDADRPPLRNHVSDPSSRAPTGPACENRDRPERHASTGVARRYRRNRTPASPNRAFRPRRPATTWPRGRAGGHSAGSR